MKMARGNHRFSALEISRLKRPGSYGDGGGLYLQISHAGARHWFCRFMLAGRSRKMGLGSVQLVSLAEAREQAIAARKLLREGIDPIEARRAGKAARLVEESKQMTFRECAGKYIASHAAGWGNAQHRAQWSSSLENYALPFIGELPVDKIEVAHVMKCLEPIWITKSETASRVRGRIESVLDWATARGFRKGENPARWRGHLENLLPARRKIAAVQHLAAMPYAEVPSFMRELRQLPGATARALEFAILTGARRGEVLGAKWSEVDLASRMWVIPASRMKSGREHRSPLSDRAMQILEGLPRGGEFIFEREPGVPLPADTLQRLLSRRMRRSETVHGFRSSFRDWAAEQTSYSTELCEMALAHAVSNKVEAAYRRGDMLEKRRRLAEDWASYCASPPQSDRANVRPIRAARS